MDSFGVVFFVLSCFPPPPPFLVVLGTKPHAFYQVLIEEQVQHSIFTLNFCGSLGESFRDLSWVAPWIGPAWVPRSDIRMLCCSRVPEGLSEGSSLLKPGQLVAESTAGSESWLWGTLDECLWMLRSHRWEREQKEYCQAAAVGMLLRTRLIR